MPPQHVSGRQMQEIEVFQEFFGDCSFSPARRTQNEGSQALHASHQLSTRQCMLSESVTREIADWDQKGRAVAGGVGRYFGARKLASTASLAAIARAC